MTTPSAARCGRPTRCDAIDEVERALRTYAEFIATYVDEHGPEWSWTTYRHADDPTTSCSVTWHADQASAARHQELDPTADFTRALYSHVVGDAEQIEFEIAAASRGTHTPSVG
jgi:hypothetical protein